MAPYSRDVTVAAFHDFYKFLGSMGVITESAIITPPPSGWPQITPAAMSGLGKDQQVIDLLQHLPYISDGAEGNRQISYQTNPMDYTGSGVRWALENGKLEGIMSPIGAGEIPAHVAVLTDASFSGSWLLLDTHEGTITDYIQFGKPERQEPPQDSPDYWRAYKTLPIAEFLEEWKQKFLTLQWVALPHDCDDGVRLQLDSLTDEIRAIYRAHGWPGDNYRREECKQALLEWDESQRQQRSE